MALTLQNTFGTPPGGTEFPGTVKGLGDLIAQYMSITGGESYITINFGSSTPSAPNRAFPWFKTDSGGVPIGWFSWNGSSWQQMPTQIASGNTASRPAGAEGLLYFDTDIRCLLVYENSAWRTAGGSPGDVKFVRNCYAAGSLVANPNITQVLTANPGWTEMTDAASRLIGAAGAGSGLTVRALGDTVGYEEIVLVEGELPAHSHTLPWTQYSGQHQNGTQPAGVYPVVTGVGSANTTEVGDNDAHDNMPPAIFLFAIIKS